MEWVALIVAVGVALLVTFTYHRGSHHAPARGDRDKAQDCWAHPDAHGRRHCAR